ncbi:flavin monoamine oxidase family protein [Tateyamaria sp. SN6-1]|uniref:flavin monoamine oxidase family protein n=1 Tax=Tateyamaria sp. SN6-1 TaxID=3092148 RepID=UPI0039F5AB55
MTNRTLIVGAGLSGLALAHQLAAEGRPFVLVEARDRVGGRILTETVGDAAFDLGPAWFWPGQPRIAALIRTLGLKQFDQYASGALTYEDADGQVQRGRGYASMEGSVRLQGGLSALTDALAAPLPPETLRLSCPVRSVTKTARGVSATTVDGHRIEAARAVLAMPPRLAAQLTLTPELPPHATQLMESTPTWMAGQAKAVAVYDTPFWRDAGLSGDAMSRHGPMVEIHDASPARDGPFALFGFIGVPPNARENTDTLRAAIIAQLERLFGPDAAHPQAVIIKDWAHDGFTATARDSAPVYAHPTYGRPAALQTLWEGALFLGGTETAPQFGGFLEGALEAAEHVMTELRDTVGMA